MYCTNHARSKQYSETSTDRCREACKNDVSCTGGYHWRQGSICYLFGVEGANDNKCTGRKDCQVCSNFVCSGIQGKKSNVVT